MFDVYLVLLDLFVGIFKLFFNNLAVYLRQPLIRRTRLALVQDTLHPIHLSLQHVVLLGKLLDRRFSYLWLGYFLEAEGELG
jgi:hypothetical protein